ncbi:kinase-like protein [Copromyces sp. CBS 386.78]|nr:kinase-like protein [Copromyces sp. CBS 386.78]
MQSTTMDAAFSDDLQNWELPTRFERGIRYHDLPRGTQCWQSVEKVGEGTSGEVWKERRYQSPLSSTWSNTCRAVKHIPKRKGNSARTSKREIKALTTFSNRSVGEYQQHFVQILGWFQDETHWYIAMEFVEHGNLQQHINRGCLPEVEAALITSQIARALLYMHAKKLVHRDLKPLNILVAHPGPRWHVKVGDFGITRDLSETRTGTHHIGTFGYMAPEVWDASQRYTFAIDVWALGAITFCMRTGSPPFPNVMDLARYPQDPTLFPTLKLSSSTQACRGFITGAMAAIPKERLTITEALAHHWLSRSLKLSQR